MYTPFAHAFAYPIKQTPYAFVAKIILCVYWLYAQAFPSSPPALIIRDSNIAILYHTVLKIPTICTPMHPPQVCELLL